MALSMAEVEAHNPRGPRRGRYFCPRCQPGGGKTPDLSIDRERGLYHCFKCGERGLLEEYRSQAAPLGRARRRRYAAQQAQAPIRPVEPACPEPAPELPEEYVVRCRRDFPASPADDYERSRGIDGVKTGMGFDSAYPFLFGDEWVSQPAVVFFFHDLDGRCVARQGRLLRQAEPGETAKVTFGKVSQGIFNLRALEEDEVVVCEGPNTAAALVERGYPAIALGGRTVHDWLIEALMDKRVWVSFDNDEPGRKGAADLRDQLVMVGCEAEVLHPSGEGQDWNDVLIQTPTFRLPWVHPVAYEPTLEDVWAQCRRMLRYATGDARTMLEEWEFALAAGYGPAREWWRRNGEKLRQRLL